MRWMWANLARRPAELRDTTPVQPETRYAKSGNVNIAYQLVGDGPPDLVAVDVISHIELDWEIPSKARFFARLASICRFFRVNQVGPACQTGTWAWPRWRRAWTTSAPSSTQPGRSGQCSSASATPPRSQFCSRPPIPSGPLG